MISVRHGTKIFQTDCPKLDCEKGGLAKDERFGIVKCPSSVKKEGDSFFLKTDECNSIIGQYNIIDDNKNEIAVFLNILGIKSKLDNKLPEIEKWCKLFLNSPKLTLKLDLIMPSFLKLQTIVEDEKTKRNEHSKICVCLSDKAHTSRIRQLQLCCSYLADVYLLLEDFVMTQDKLKFNDNELKQIYIFAKYLNQTDLSFLSKKCISIAKKNIQKAGMRPDGDIYFFVKQPQIAELYQLMPYIKDIETIFKKTCHNEVIKIIETFVNNHEMFNANFNPYVSCVEIDTLTNNVKKIAIDYGLLSKYIEHSTNGLLIDAKFLSSFIDEKYKSFIYKSCFAGLIQYHSQVIQKICKTLKSLNIDDDIKLFLIHLCQSFKGYNSSALTTNDANTLIRLIKTFKIGESAYSSFVKSRRLHELFVLKFDLLHDLKKLPLPILIDFFVYYENEWKKYEKELDQLEPKYKIRKFSK